jgi:hypothetical protein
MQTIWCVMGLSDLCWDIANPWSDGLLKVGIISCLKSEASWFEIWNNLEFHAGVIDLPGYEYALWFQCKFSFFFSSDDNRSPYVFLLQAPLRKSLQFSTKLYRIQNVYGHYNEQNKFENYHYYYYYYCISFFFLERFLSCVTSLCTMFLK